MYMRTAEPRHLSQGQWSQYSLSELCTSAILNLSQSPSILFKKQQIRILDMHPANVLANIFTWSSGSNYYNIKC